LHCSLLVFISLVIKSDFKINRFVKWHGVCIEKELSKPLVFSNKKSQEDVVNEVLNAIKSGAKIILFMVFVELESRQ
jgi:hypothetical protein